MALRFLPSSDSGLPTATASCYCQLFPSSFSPVFYNFRLETNSPNNDSMRYILLLYALSAFIVAGGLLFRRVGKASAILALFVLMFGLEILDFLYGTSRVKSIYPQFFGYYYFVAGFIYGPVLWWHMRFIVQKSYRFRLPELLHLAPALAVCWYLADILAMPGPERISYINQHFLTIIMPVNYARAAHLLGYGLLITWFLSRSYHHLVPRQRLYTGLVTAIYFIACVVISWLTEFADSWRDFDIYYLIASTIILIIGWLLYSDPVFLQQIAQKYLKSALSEEAKVRIREKIDKLLVSDQVFRQKNLSVQKLADAIDEKSHHLSQTFSDVFGEPFNEHINRYRVDFAKELLLSDDFKRYTIEAIAIEAGFNNKVTFSKAFRQYTAQTPSEYRKAHHPNGGQ